MTFWTEDMQARSREVDQQLSNSLEKHRNQGGLIRVLRDSQSKRFFATLDVARVSQLDANLLDEELIKLGREAVERVCKLFTWQYRGAESDLMLRMLVWWFYMRVNLPSPGQALQNLRYRNETMFSHAWNTRGVLTLQGDQPTRLQRVAHLVLSIIVPFAFSRLRERLTEQAEEWEEHMETVDKTVHFARLLNFVLFLVDGRYRTVVDRVLRMRLVPIKNECVRSVSFELMNQQLLFDGFTQFILVIFPLVDWHGMWRLAVRAKTLVMNATGLNTVVVAPRATAVEEACAYCNCAKPVMPHRALPCDHVYCYFCIKSLSYSSSSMRCVACEQHVDKVERA